MPNRPTMRRGKRERFSRELRSSDRFHQVVVEGFNCDSTCPRRRVNVTANFNIRHSGGKRRVDLATYGVLLAGALAGGFVSGLAGFGTALMALGIWLYILPPAIAVPLVLICSVSSQISTLPSMWKLLDFKLALPFVAGGLLGMPIGALLVARADPQTFKLSVGVMLLVFPTALFFIRKPMAFRFGGRIADACVGFAGGILGGLAGLSGPLPTLWASIHGWTKDQRRGVFQIFNGTVLSAALILQVASGFVKLNVFWLALLAMPGTLIGARIGMRTYHALNDRNFYDVVLAQLFLSGAGLVWSSIAPR